MIRAAICCGGLLVSGFLTLATQAADDGDMAGINVEPVLKQLDRNHDGYVDRQEAKQIDSLAAAFDEEDRNKDGKIDRAELAKLLARIGAPALPGAH